MKATKELFQECQKLGFRFLRTRSLNQDPLENSFFSIRNLNGSNTNPNCTQFVSSFKTWIVNNLISSNSKNKNCEDDSGSVLENLQTFLDETPSLDTVIQPAEITENTPVIIIESAPSTTSATNPDNNAASTSDKQSQISSACSVITTELSSIKATSRGTKWQTAMSHFIPKKMSSTDKSKVDLAIMKLFTWDFQPFTMVEDKGFKNLMSICAPEYKIPSRKYFSNSLIPAKFEEICQDVKNTLSEQALSVCITTDAWTSSVNDSYCALTAHYINEHFEMKTVLLDCSVFKDSHTAENLAEYITKMVSEWLISESDNASNITSAVTNILKWKHYGCYAHKLNLVVQDALRHVKDVLMKVKAIVTYFKRSNAATRKLVTYQEQIGIKQPKKLLQDVVTRWNSTYFMLQRITLLEEAVKHSLALSNTDLPLLTEHEWNTCRELCMVLEPCAEVTTEISSENYITASKIIRGLTRGLKFLTKLSNHVKINSIKLVVQALLDGIATRYSNLEKSKSLVLCTFLDPRYKHHLFEDEKTTDWIKKSTIQLVAGIISKESVMQCCQPENYEYRYVTTQIPLLPATVVSFLISLQI
ncbi:zinc finger BED domain-containing protein 4-like [Sitophilus oryzae]|uniref:Zinc finger BED domain-containing protein 4-like n=1 Tax=Sitophilus oryzae TaxID=7048 RepID=A0A6J2YAS1_SITOR|nr:zinc finger BED domain-containing protein 4-like [Sitophilus oryzae]